MIIRTQILFFLLFLAPGCISAQPKNLNECNNYFDKTLSRKDIEYIRNLKEDDLSELHFTLGLNIRNKWIRGNRNPELVKYFHDLGLFNPDDISGVILQNYWSYLNNKTFDLNAQIVDYKKYWEQAKKYEEQNQLNIEYTDSKFKGNLINLEFIKNSNVPKLKIPDKNTANDIFCDEFIKYKDGYIINSLTTSPDREKIANIRYKYYYFDLLKRQVYELKIKGFDFVESIISIENVLYIAGKFNNKSKIVKYENEKGNLLNLISLGNIQEISDESWIKLGKFKSHLYALQNNGAYRFDGNYWDKLAQFNLTELIKSNSISSDSIIPTENIKVTNDKIYFLHEILQGRDCYLLEIDLKTDSLYEFWRKNKIFDNYKKEISSYTLIGYDSVFISASILDYESLVLSESNNFNALIYNNKIKSDLAAENTIKSRIVIKNSEKFIIVAENGLFSLEKNIIKPLAYFENVNQLVPINKVNNYHFNFQPRCCELIQNNVYLIGGLFGGLLIVDLEKNEIACFDDLKDFETFELLID
jgi:hypothetical protein